MVATSHCFSYSARILIFFPLCFRSGWSRTNTTAFRGVVPELGRPEGRRGAPGVWGEGGLRGLARVSSCPVAVAFLVDDVYVQLYSLCPLLPVTRQAPLNRQAPDVRTPRKSHVMLRATAGGLGGRWLCHPGAAAPASLLLPGALRDGAQRLSAASRIHLLLQAACHVLAPWC